MSKFNNKPFEIGSKVMFKKEFLENRPMIDGSLIYTVKKFSLNRNVCVLEECLFSSFYVDDLIEYDNYE